MMPLTYAKHVCLRALSDSYKDRIEILALNGKTRLREIPSFGIINIVLWKNAPHEN